MGRKWWEEDVPYHWPPGCRDHINAAISDRNWAMDLLESALTCLNRWCAEGVGADEMEEMESLRDSLEAEIPWLQGDPTEEDDDGG